MTPRELTPRQIVAELDKYIIGQRDAKRAVAIAVRNRWRRQRLQGDLAREVSPRNIIMVGPTGVGKTEIARRLARLVDAPFIKIEATKFTEVGYHGRDVDSMIRDLLDLAIKMVRNEQAEIVKVKAQEAVEQRLVSILLGREPSAGGYIRAEESELGGEETSRTTRDRMLERLRQGVFDDREIELSVRESASVPLIGGMGPDQLDPGVSSMLEQLMPARHKMRKVSVTEARRILLEEETDKLIDRDLMISEAIARTEQSGIIFLDEIDKIAGREGAHGPDVSREGVQRDILPIVEGTTVNTKYGMVKTDHVLFIAAGAFHISKPSDLIPELQGRFPIRVELEALGRDEFVRILTEPKSALIKQYTALMATEGVTLEFTPEAIARIAELATLVNERTENIGARRLHTVMERLLDEVSFHAPELDGQSVRVDAPYVDRMLEDIARSDDLSRYIL